MVTAALFLALLVTAMFLIASRVVRLALHGNALRLTCEIYYPIVLMMVYGLAAIPLLFRAPSFFPGYLGVDFAALDIIYAFLIMMLGALSYFLGFNLAYRPPTCTSTWATKSLRDSSFNAGAIALAIVDVMVRLQQIVKGQYFDWMRGRAADLYGDGQSALWLLQDGLAPILTAIATHRAQKNRIWLIYLFALLFAMLLEGKRTKIVLAVASALVVHFMLRKSRIQLSRLVFYAVIGIFGMSFTSSVILEARIMFRTNINGALTDPVGFVQDIAFEVVPHAFVNTFTDSKVDTSVIRGTSFAERMPTWSISLASETKRVAETDFLPLENLFDEITIVVPSALWFGDKPSIGISTTIANYYDLWAPNTLSRSADLASTALVNPYLYSGLPGLLIYASLLGTLVGWTARYATARFGVNGLLLMIGSIYYLRPLSNSMAGPIVGLRNFIIIIMLFLMAEIIMRSFWRFRAPAYRPSAK